MKYMDFIKVSASLMGFSIAALLIALGIAFAGIMGVMVVKDHLFTASLVGSGGVTISTPDNNATLTSPVHVSAFVAAGFTGPVRTMQIFRDNTLVYQAAGTTVETNVDMSASASHNLTVLALKKNGSLEGSATVYVPVVTATPTPLPLPPSASSVPALPPVPSP